jgi:acyl-CoA reductase-like NAD-dependent aldehyde dehydrogenase
MIEVGRVRKLVYSGEIGSLAEGFFVPPTILRCGRDGDDCRRRFWPVLAVMKAGDLSEGAADRTGRSMR